jgi:hypothetical protein
MSALSAVAAAAPVVTPLHIHVEGVGSAGTLVAGEDVAISWDNSVSGDDNPDVTDISQVVFDVLGIASVEADSVAGGVFSVTYTLTEGDGEAFDAVAGVTVTSPSGTTGPVYGLETVDFDANPPVVSQEHIHVDYSGASGAGGTFHPGDTVVATWDDSSTGDDNQGVVEVEFEFFRFIPTSGVESGSGIWEASYTFSTSDFEFTNETVAVTATDWAGNQTGPVWGQDPIDFSTSPPPSVPTLALLPSSIATLAMTAMGAWALRSRRGASVGK